MIRSYFNQKAPIWDETIAEKDVTKLEEMAHRLDIKSESFVLDVGTGTGIFVPFLLNKIGRNGRLVAIDIAEEMLRLARVKSFSTEIDHIHADIVTLPINGETFHTVVCYSSFPHFEDKARALREIHRMLRKNGRLFICHTSSRQEINELHYQIPEVHMHLLPEDDEMRRLLSAAGFGEISVFDGEDSYLASAVKAD